MEWQERVTIITISAIGFIFGAILLWNAVPRITGHVYDPTVGVVSGLFIAIMGLVCIISGAYWSIRASR